MCFLQVKWTPLSRLHNKVRFFPPNVQNRAKDVMPIAYLRSSLETWEDMGV